MLQAARPQPFRAGAAPAGRAPGHDACSLSTPHARRYLQLTNLPTANETQHRSRAHWHPMGQARHPDLLQAAAGTGRAVLHVHGGRDRGGAGPVVGVVIGGMLVPAATLGLMAATEEATKGRFPMPIRADQRVPRGPPAGAGHAGAGRDLHRRLRWPPPAWPRCWRAARPAGGRAKSTASTLLALALHTPLFLMFWHAPALVHWHGVSPVKSLFFSVVACLRNFGAFLIYGMACGWPCSWASGSVFGLVGGLLGGPAMARAVMMPMALLMAAMFSTSIYFTFRDSFVATPDAEQRPPESAVCHNAILQGRCEHRTSWMRRALVNHCVVAGDVVVRDVVPVVPELSTRRIVGDHALRRMSHVHGQRMELGSTCPDRRQLGKAGPARSWCSSRQHGLPRGAAPRRYGEAAQCPAHTPQRCCDCSKSGAVYLVAGAVGTSRQIVAGHPLPSTPGRTSTGEMH